MRLQYKRNVLNYYNLISLYVVKFINTYYANLITHIVADTFVMNFRNLKIKFEKQFTTFQTMEMKEKELIPRCIPDPLQEAECQINR